MIDHRGGQRVWMIMALFARQYIFIVSPFEGNEWMNGLSLQAMKWLLQNVNYYYLQGVLYSLSSCQLLPSRDRMMFTSFQYLCKLLKIVYLSFLMSAGRYVLGRCLKLFHLQIYCFHYDSKPVVILIKPYDRYLRLWSRKYKQFTWIVIFARRSFIRLAIDEVNLIESSVKARFCLDPPNKKYNTPML